MITITHSATLCGVEAILVPVEVQAYRHIPGIQMVGLPDNTIRESKERIRIAIKESGFEFPPLKVTVNLVPADLKKEGSAFDLPIAVGILKSLEAISSAHDEDYLIVGELSLSGIVNPIAGALPIAILAKKLGKKGVILPKANCPEITFVDGIERIGVSSLSETVAFLSGKTEILSERETEPPGNSKDEPNMQQIIGQSHAKRALEIAAAGHHHTLLIGPPGCGKTMLSERLPTLLPPMDRNEILEISQVYSVMGLLQKGKRIIRERPFCIPHHTITSVGLIGGGLLPKPGVVSLAHHGVLFLDEFPEFGRAVLDTLRQPLESKRVVICRAKESFTFPADFLLIASMNPCPCGYLLGRGKECRCALQRIQQYQQKISGPILDRLEIRVELSAISFDEVSSKEVGEPSSIIRQRVIQAREKLNQKETHGQNHLMRSKPSLIQLLKECSIRFNLSTRGLNSVLRVADTIAALDRSDSTKEDHVLEALQYRSPVLENQV